MPKQPIRVIIGYSPGGTSDLVARLGGESIYQKTGQTVLPENKSGALGFIALKTVAAAAPDGYTVGIANMGTLSVAPVVPGSQIPLNLDKDLAPICNLVGVPMALVTRPNAPYGTVAELIAYAKANPGKVTFASTGAGSTNQLAAELLGLEAGGLKMLHVPYRGGAPAMQDLAAGQVDIFIGNVSDVVGQVRGGQVKALALASSHPNAMVPDLPLITKDIPSLDINNWFGLVGPASLPPDLVAGLAKLFLDALAVPSVDPTLAARGLERMPQDTRAFRETIEKDRQRWARVARLGDIRADK